MNQLFSLRNLTKGTLAFLTAAIVPTISGTTTYSARSSTTDANPKNILLIQTDHELSYQHGTENDTYNILRPNYDRFVSEGVEFVNARAATPLCSPARRSAVTGLYPHQHGIITNSEAIPPYYTTDSIYDTLIENRFDINDVYFYGKTHWSGNMTSNDTPMNTYGVTGWATTGYGQPYKQPEYHEYLRRNNYFGSPYNKPWMLIAEDSLTPNSTPAKNEQKDLDSFGIITGNIFGIMQTPKEFHEAYFLADMVNNQLKDIKKQNSDEPFVMSVNFWGPHHPYYPTQEFVDLYTDENGVLGGDIEMYPSFLDQFVNKPSVYAWDNSRNANPSLPLRTSEDEWEKFKTYMAIAYAQTTLIDNAIGTILDTLEETGLDKNTVVIWTNDHGDALGSHGGHADKEAYMIEETCHIQMAVKDPMRPDLAGTKNYAFVNTTDVPVTMLDVLGLKFNKEVAGMSMLDLMYEEATPREYMVIEHNGHFSDTRARTVYYGDYKYTYYDKFIDELYNLKDDPFEMNNLILEQSQQGRISLMKEMLHKWQIETKDIIPLVNN